LPRYDLPRAAPEPLRLVQLFVNTADIEHGHEWLPVPQALEDWLGEHAPPPPEATERDLARALELREAFRALLRANRGDRIDPDAVATVNRVARVKLELDAEAVPRIRSDAPLGRIVAVAFEAMLDGSWPRLKSCPQCGWAFYDYSKNRSATWCSMAICGNRLKTRAYRRRKADR
jgi:predicted RNA-binding Zn ribbon-like protein